MLLNAVCSLSSFAKGVTPLVTTVSAFRRVTVELSADGYRNATASLVPTLATANVVRERLSALPAAAEPVGQSGAGLPR